MEILFIEWETFWNPVYVTVKKAVEENLMHKGRILCFILSYNNLSIYIYDSFFKYLEAFVDF